MTHTLHRWGNSLALRIPRRFLHAAGLVDGSAVDLRFENGRIVITPLSSPPTLDQLLDGMRRTGVPRPIPDRGEVVTLARRGADSPPADRQMVFVLSPAAYVAATGVVVACPVVPRPAGSPFEVPLPPSRRLGGGVILADRITSISLDGRELTRESRVPPATLRAVQERLLPLLVANPQRILTASEGVALPAATEMR